MSKVKVACPKFIGCDACIVNCSDLIFELQDSEDSKKSLWSEPTTEFYELFA
jgi:hypothetical protein